MKTPSPRALVVLATMLVLALLIGVYEVQPPARQAAEPNAAVAPETQAPLDSASPPANPASEPALTSSAMEPPAQLPGQAPSAFANVTLPDTANQSSAGSSEPISEHALRQIAALEREKAARTPVQNKIDSQLLAADRMSRGLPVADGVTNFVVALDRDEEGRVLVDIKANVTDELLTRIGETGGQVINSFTQYHAIRAALPLEQMEVVAAQPEVRFIEPAVRALTNVGSATSEGDKTHQADTARADFGADGTGVKVGVISDSQDYLARSQGSDDLGPVTVIQGQEGQGEGEGTAMLEIVHDLAPGAELFFATGNGGPAVFADNIRKLRAAGCDIIVDDLTYANESPFQDGIIAQAVNDVVADGALYFSSAANSGHITRNQSGTWEGDFSGGSTLQDVGQFHQFGNAEYNTLTSSSGNPILLFWADPLGGAVNDYDLFILDAAGNAVLTGSNNRQTGTEDPLEGVVGNVITNSVRIVVIKHSGDARFLHIDTSRGRLALGTSGSTRGHNAAEQCLCVAAVYSGTSYPDAFTGGAKNPVEQFSSDGPRRIFFTPNGTAITPGNFLSTGGQLLQKPDIAAADGVTTTVAIPGQPANQQPFVPFFGTSAAAPHAAAIAALLKSYDPTLTANQIRQALFNTALDIESPGVDRDSGYGLIMAEAALQSLQAPVPPTLTSFAPTNGAVGAAVVLTGTKFDNVSAVKFNNVSATFTVNSRTQISANVPATATTGRITVTTAAGTATSDNDFTVLPSAAITAFNPTRGAAGSTVVISGANFTGATTVTFNGVNATFTVDSATQITATVPASATTGRLAVTTPAGTATSSANFTVTTVPSITGFSPASGGIGTSVIIAGANLGAATSVKFNGNTATFTANSDVQITATVPAGATSGPITVTTPGGTATSANSFNIVSGPGITAFTPSSGPAGTEVSITGQNLNGATGVRFNGVAALTFLVQSPTQILTVVPPGATTGPVSVITPGGTATSGLSFTVVSKPANDNFADAQTLNGTSGTVNGDNAAATKEPEEPSHANNEGGRSLWYRWTPPTTGSYRFDTAPSDFNTLLAVYAGNVLTNLTLQAQNDDTDETDQTSSVTFLANGGTTYRIAVDGHTFGPGGPTNGTFGTVRLEWESVPTSPVITGFSPSSGSAGASVVITGANLTGATAVRFGGISAAFTVDSANQITATVPAGAVTGKLTVQTPSGLAVSTASFTVIGVVNNDQFANAQTISGTAGSVTGNNEFASKEAGEPMHANFAGGKSVWYRWTAPSSGQWTFDTTGSDFDTLLAVYTGSSVNALTEQASNDDQAGARTSQLILGATAGATYVIAVDGYGGASGNVVLNWRQAAVLPRITSFNPTTGVAGTQVVIQGVNFTGATSVRFKETEAGFTVDSPTQITATVPNGAQTGPLSVITPQGRGDSLASFGVGTTSSNDNFANAQPLSGALAITGGTTAGATLETGEPLHAYTIGGHSIWYRWTAPSNGTWTVDLSGSDFDTLLAIYTGSSVMALSPITWNDDYGDDLTSRTTLDATSGMTYYIAVAGYGDANGDVTLRLFPDTSGGLLYQTGFELWEGFWGMTLDGYGNWTSYGNGGNGVVSGYLPGYGQNAYIGYSPAPNPGEAFYLWTPLDYTPDPATLPVVRFSVVMNVVDSTVLEYDDFEWQVYNRTGDRLFTLDFDNNNLHVYYRPSGTNSYVDTGITFQNSVTYALTIVMDFGANRWDAFLDSTQVVTNQAISTGGLPLTLGDIDAVWNPGAAAGNNYMLFDNYTVTVEPGRMPEILLQPQSQSVELGSTATLGVVARGEEPLEYQWRLEGTNLPNATGPVLTLRGVTAAQAGHYSVAIRNTAGTTNSQDAVVSVNQPPNLVPWQPVGWSGPLVVTTTAGTTTDATSLNEGQALYLNWAMDNYSEGAITNAFFVRLYVDNQINHEWQVNGLEGLHYTYITDYPLGALSVGGHALRLEADPTGAVTESSEIDNTHLRTIVIAPSAGAPPELTGTTYQPGSAFQFYLGGEAGRSYTVQVSSNLVIWDALTNVTGAATPVLIRDPAAADASSRFYRAVLDTP